SKLSSAGANLLRASVTRCPQTQCFVDGASYHPERLRRQAVDNTVQHRDEPFDQGCEEMRHDSASHLVASSRIPKTNLLNMPLLDVSDNIFAQTPTRSEGAPVSLLQGLNRARALPTIPSNG